MIFRVGDPVGIAHTNYRGRVVEIRGPLGPGGAQVYRIRYRDASGSRSDIELQDDQLELIHKVTTVEFNDIRDRLKKPLSRGRAKRLVYPDRVAPFVAQPITVEEFPAGHQPLDSDILLFSAPAAVGKSTFARRLAADSGVPVLDLAKELPAAGGLGLLTDISHDAQKELIQGQLSLIVDALDEGLMMSSENIEAFLTDIAEDLSATGVPNGRGPKLLFFGRPLAVEQAAHIFERHAPSLPVTRLALEFFDEKHATKLVMAYARELSEKQVVVDRNEPKIKDLISEFFDAIAAALDLTREALWQDDRGRGFAGYAPVLVSLGALIAAESEQENPDFAQYALRVKHKGGGREAWGVLENVTEKILLREMGKVRAPLLKDFPGDIPDTAYNPIDQLDRLASFILDGATPEASCFGRSPNVAFAPTATAAEDKYLVAVKTHLREHPFLRGGGPVNSVLGALILAHKIVDTTINPEDPTSPTTQLLAEYGRQPFLWRFLRPHLHDDLFIRGSVASYVMSSVWADSTVDGEIEIRPVEREHARLEIIVDDTTVSAAVMLPLELRGEIGNLDVDLPEEEVVLTRWPSSNESQIGFLGRSRVKAKTIDFQVRRVYVGALGFPASCLLDAEQVLHADRVERPVKDAGSELRVAGAFENLYRWKQVAPVVDPPPPPTDTVGTLLAEFERRIPSVMSLVVFPDFTLSDDVRLNWARKPPFEALVPQLFQALASAGFATTRIIQTSKQTRMRFSPRVTWSALREAYGEPKKANPKLVAVLNSLK